MWGVDATGEDAYSSGQGDGEYVSREFHGERDGAWVSGSCLGDG